MTTQSVTKRITASIIYVLLLSVALIAFNIAFHWLAQRVLLPLFGWFYDAPFLEKVFVLITGVVAIIIFFETMFMWLNAALHGLLYRFLGKNSVLFFASIAMCLGNFLITTAYLFPLWQLNVWIIMLWLMMWGITVQFNWLLLYKQHAIR